VTITAIHADDDDDDDEGRLTGFAKVTRDLTERRAAEDSLRSAVAALREANAELDRFASIAAHDMTDPLSTMTGFAEILERGTLPPEKVTEYAGHIRASGLRLMRMLQGLLAYARAGKSDLPSIAVDLAAATTQVIDDLAALVAERDAAVDVDLPDGAAAVTQPRDLRLVLQNLISNALKFADAGDPRVAIRGERLDGGWRISVRDNGAGIAAADTDRIFKAFERADAGDEAGYGLGLAICHRLVERLGGEIGVRSQPGAGSCFWFTLPD
jgi:signal transduction histidine kinase